MNRELYDEAIRSGILSRKQKENRKDSWYLRIYRGNCSSQLFGSYNSRTCDHAWI